MQQRSFVHRWNFAEIWIDLNKVIDDNVLHRINDTTGKTKKSEYKKENETDDASLKKRRKNECVRKRAPKRFEKHEIILAYWRTLANFTMRFRQLFRRVYAHKIAAAIFSERMRLQLQLRRHSARWFDALGCTTVHCAHTHSFFYHNNFYYSFL